MRRIRPCDCVLFGFAIEGPITRYQIHLQARSGFTGDEPRIFWEDYSPSGLTSSDALFMQQRRPVLPRPSVQTCLNSQSQSAQRISTLPIQCLVSICSPTAAAMTAAVQLGPTYKLFNFFAL